MLLRKNLSQLRSQLSENDKKQQDTVELKHQQTFLDWRKRGLVNVRESGLYSRRSRGVFATEDIPMPPDLKSRIKKKNRIKLISQGRLPYVGDFSNCKIISDEVVKTGHRKALAYTITVPETHNSYDLADSWIGTINHAPPAKCNIIVVGTKLYQINAIRKDEELFFDYGVDYWVFQLTGHDIDYWMKEDQKYWHHLHKYLENYSPLMKMKLKSLMPYDILLTIDKYFYPHNQ